MALGHVKVCPFPSDIRSLTPNSSFYVCTSRGSMGPHGSCVFGRDGARALGSNEVEPFFLGSGEARPIPLGSGKAWPTSKGYDEWNLCPKGQAKWNMSPGVG
jgi:hypothetical protein